MADGGAKASVKDGFMLCSAMVARLSSEITCPVCLDFLTDPRILGCSHTFCLPCLEPILDGRRVKCPTCRVVTLLAEGQELRHLRKNLLARVILEEINGAKRSMGGLEPPGPGPLPREGKAGKAEVRGITALVTEAASSELSPTSVKSREALILKACGAFIRKGIEARRRASAAAPPARTPAAAAPSPAAPPPAASPASPSASSTSPELLAGRAVEEDEDEWPVVPAPVDDDDDDDDDEDPHSGAASDDEEFEIVAMPPGGPFALPHLPDAAPVASSSSAPPPLAPSSSSSSDAPAALPPAGAALYSSAPGPSSRSIPAAAAGPELARALSAPDAVATPPPAPRPPPIDVTAPDSGAGVSAPRPGGRRRQELAAARQVADMLSDCVDHVDGRELAEVCSPEGPASPYLRGIYEGAVRLRGGEEFTPLSRSPSSPHGASPPQSRTSSLGEGAAPPAGGPEAPPGRTSSARFERSGSIGRAFVLAGAPPTPAGPAPPPATPPPAGPAPAAGPATPTSPEAVSFESLPKLEEAGPFGGPGGAEFSCAHRALLMPLPRSPAVQAFSQRIVQVQVWTQGDALKAIRAVYSDGQASVTAGRALDLKGAAPDQVAVMQEGERIVRVRMHYGIAFSLRPSRGMGASTAVKGLKVYTSWGRELRLVKNGLFDSKAYLEVGEERELAGFFGRCSERHVEALGFLLAPRAAPSFP